MLVLSRQRDETIMIGDEVMITIVDIRGDKVRLGITAPTKIAVHRKEVYDAIKAENERAAQLASADADALRAAFRGQATQARSPLAGPHGSPPTQGAGPGAGSIRPRLSGSAARVGPPVQNAPSGTLPAKGPHVIQPLHAPERAPRPLRMEGAG